MTPEEYLAVGPDRSRFGAVARFPRRVAWKLVRPYVAALVERNLLLEDDLSALKKELLATNHRISWLESLVEKRDK
jgi:hypothetical protein